MHAHPIAHFVIADIAHFGAKSFDVLKLHFRQKVNNSQFIARRHRPKNSIRRPQKIGELFRMAGERAFQCPVKIGKAEKWPYQTQYNPFMDIIVAYLIFLRLRRARRSCVTISARSALSIG